MAMPKWEKKLLDWITAHMAGVVLAAAVLLGGYARFQLRHFASGDFERFLYGWYAGIAHLGGLGALSQQIGNYNIPYQLCIALLTYLPLPSLYAYKLLSIFFDALLAAAAGLLAFRIGPQRPERRLWSGVIAASVVWCSPLVVLNSAAWAQCDSIYTFFAVAALAVLILTEKPLPALVLLGVAFAFKLQAIFLLPFFLIVWFAQRRFSILNFAAIPGMMLLLSVPGLLAGRGWTEVFGLYGRQAAQNPELGANYPSPWVLFGNFIEEQQHWGYDYQAVAMIACLLALGIACCMLAKTPGWHSPTGLLYTAFISVYTCVLLLPAMHERYGYLYEILAILVMVLWPKTGKYCAALVCISLVTYGGFLQAEWSDLYRIDLQFLAIANVAVYFAYLTDYLRRLRAGFALAAPQAAGAVPEQTQS